MKQNLFSYHHKIYLLKSTIPQFEWLRVKIGDFASGKNCQLPTEKEILYVPQINEMQSNPQTSAEICCCHLPKATFFHVVNKIMLLLKSSLFVFLTKLFCRLSVVNLITCTTLLACLYYLRKSSWPNNYCDI